MNIFLYQNKQIERDSSKKVLRGSYKEIVNLWKPDISEARHNNT